MPITHKGTHICNRCQKNFDWIHFDFTRQKMGSKFLTVEQVPHQLIVHRFTPTADGKFEVKVNCPHCDFYNQFIFPEENTNEALTIK